MSTEQNKSAKLEGAGGEWQEKTFSQLGKIVTGKTPPSAVSGFFGGNIPFVTPTDFDERRFISSTKRYLTEKGADSINSSRIPNMAIMISCIGSDMGKVAISETECFTNQQINSIIVEPDNNPIFIYYNLSNRKLEIRSVAGGSAQPILNKSAFGELNIILPPLEEQRAIAHILGTLDDKIELNRRTNETLEAMAQALFKFWFVDFGPVRAKMEGRWRRGQSLPGLPAHLFDLFPDRLVDSELGEIPEGWRISHIIDEFNIIMGQSPPGKTYNDDGKGLPFYQGCSDFSFRFPIRRIYCTAPSRFAKKGETLVSVRAPVGDINMASEDCAIGRGVAAACHKTGNQSYTYQFMRALNGKLLCFEAEGTVFGSIGKKDFNAMTCLAPPNNLVIYYEKELSSIDKCIEINEYQSRTLTVLRDTLLPKLISGELRVRK